MFTFIQCKWIIKTYLLAFGTWYQNPFRVHLSICRSVFSSSTFTWVSLFIMQLIYFEASCVCGSALSTETRTSRHGTHPQERPGQRGAVLKQVIHNEGNMRKYAQETFRGNRGKGQFMVGRGGADHCVKEARTPASKRGSRARKDLVVRKKRTHKGIENK